MVNSDTQIRGQKNEQTTIRYYISYCCHLKFVKIQLWLCFIKRINFPESNFCKKEFSQLSEIYNSLPDFVSAKFYHSLNWKLNVKFGNEKHNNEYWNFKDVHCYTVYIPCHFKAEVFNTQVCKRLSIWKTTRNILAFLDRQNKIYFRKQY